MKRDELESLSKSFLLFFISIELLMTVILYLYYKEQISYQEDTIFLEMKNFNYTLKGEKFHVDLVTKEAGMQTFVLEKGSKDFFVYFPIPQVDTTLLKVIYPRQAYDLFLVSLQKKFLWIFLAVTVFAALFSLAFALYTLRPLRKSLKHLEEFLKDMIHDLNTPVTAILLNTKLLRKNYKAERLERIDLSAKTIVSLHKNLESFLRNVPLDKHTVNLRTLLEARVEYFKSIYPTLVFTLEGEEVYIDTNEDGMQRIIDNLLGNACKYNRPNGCVAITLLEKSFTVEDSGYGIKNIHKIFDRFYKEGERGLGIGLHIVKKLCEALDLEITVRSSKSGSCFTLSWN